MVTIPPRWRRRLAVLTPLAPFVALLVVSLAVHWTSLLEAGRPFYVDSDLPLTYDDYAVRYFSTWNANNDHLNFGQFMRIPYMGPLYLLFRGLGVDVTVFVRFLFWLPTYLGMATSYLFFRHVLGTDRQSRRIVVVSFLLAISYGLHPWILKHYLHYFFRVSFAVLPLAFLWFVMYVHAGRRRHLVLTAVAVVFLGGNPHFLVYFAILAGLFVLVEGLLSRRLVTLSGRAGAAGALSIAFSLFWLLPFVISTLSGESVVGYNVGERMVSLFSERSDPVNLFSFMAGLFPAVLEEPWWLFEPMWFYQTVFLAIPIAALAGFLATGRDDRFALFAGVAIVLLTALATGYKYGWPIGGVYDAILQLPFHGVMRAPARIQAILPLLFGYLIGRAAIDGDRAVLRGGAIALLGIVCVAAVAMSAPVFGQALAPTDLPEDFERVEAADYEDAFLSPPRPLGGYNPDWMFAREGGIAESLDTHLYARPDTRQHYLNYYVLELIDRDETPTAIDVLRKTGANHFVVRTDDTDRQGVPPSERLVSRLDEHLPRVDAGPNVVVYRITPADETDPFGIVRPVQGPRDLHAGAAVADQPAVYPTFPTDVPADPMLEDLDGIRRFHPANTFARINQMGVLPRPPTYAGVTVRGQRTVSLPDRPGSLFVRVTPLNRGAEIIRQTEDGEEITKLRDGVGELRLPLDGGRIRLRGPMYVERLAVTDQPVQRPDSPVGTSFHGTGTLTPDQTDVSHVVGPDSVELAYRVTGGGTFPQASFTPETPLEGPFTVDVSVTSAAGSGDRLGFVLLREHRDALVLPFNEYLQSGRHDLTVHVPGYPNSTVTRIQLAVFLQQRPTEDTLTIHDLSVREGLDAPPTVESRPECDDDPSKAHCEGAAVVRDVERVSPTRYELTVDADAPYTLHMGQAFDASWTAEVAGSDGTTSYDAHSLYLASTGFSIDETGTHTVTVRYRPERWFHAGIALSALAALASVAALAVGRYRRGSGRSLDLRERLAAVRERGRRLADRDSGGRDRL